MFVKDQRINTNDMVVKDAYLVEGMVCKDCEHNIKEAIRNVNGVSHAHADLSSSSISFEYDPVKTSLDDVKFAVLKLGYKIVDKMPPQGSEDQRDGCCS